MRELCRSGGSVVASVVAVLEKQQQQIQPAGKSVAAPPPLPSKNSGRSADVNFESAVKDFDSVAEDVERLVRRCKSGRTAEAPRMNAEPRLSSVVGHLKQRRDAPAEPSTSNQTQDDRMINRSSFSSSEEEEDGSDESSSGESSQSTDSLEHHRTNDGLETIAEEDQRNSTPYQGLEEEDEDEDSDIDEQQEPTPPPDQCAENNSQWTKDGGDSSDASVSSPSPSSASSSSSSTSQASLRDSSTRCNNDFQWIHKQASAKAAPKMEGGSAKPPIAIRAKTPKKEKSPLPTAPAPGSLDRRRHHHHHHQQRQDREQKSRSIHIPKSPPRLDDFTPCQNWCCAGGAMVASSFAENFHRRHERSDPQRYGSSPMLMDGRNGSHPDLYGDCNGRFGRHGDGMGMMGCCGYHGAPQPPPPCCFYGDRVGGYRWTPPPFPKPNEQDEKFRKLQYEKDNMQLQVQVLSEQIEAQADKIADLEKTLSERKQLLVDAEQKLQNEVLARSSLETQKLELMSIMSELKLQQAALERENIELRTSHHQQYNNNGDVKKPPLMPRMAQTSTPIHHASSQGLNSRMSQSPSPVTLSGTGRRTPPLHPEPPPKTPPANYKRQIDLHYGSLPRQQFLSNGSGTGFSTSSSVVDSNANPSAKKGVAFAPTETIVIDDSSGDASSQSPTLQFNKNRGIKKIFGRMKRSGSGNLEDLPGLNEFQRGGVRATASARLGWSEPQLSSKPDKPFAEWDTENICDWLQDLGLDQYIPEAKRWIKSGQQLQEASISDVEKELNVKNPLHKKKLQLALIDTEENGSSDPHLSQAGQLDTAWVLRWLDDTGLPQHKENFLINRVDGRVLHRLTLDDLALLHITSMLHVASIKRGIQVLRENGYEPGCLQRRSLPDDPPHPTPAHIALWTTHRVMEWLRAVDLAEYAPNLRGAGVHGGLMVHETKFTAELLAALLNIPPGKTLLRRHLKTHFNDLLGKEIIQVKREAESTMGYVPLTPSSKLKVAKKSQFSLKRKKSKGEADYGDLVCPLNPDKNSGELNGSATSVGMMTRMASLEAEDVSLRHVETNVVRSSPASIANSPIPQRHV